MNRGFRVWNGFAFEDFFYTYYLSEEGRLYRVKHDDVLRYVGDDCVLMFSTGLKDSDGKEIFEGDTVEVGCDGEKTVHQVRWGGEFDYPAFDIYPGIDSGSNDLRHCICAIEYSIKIIGNCFENPELLKG